MDAYVGEPRHASYECWSLKLNATPLALLVDWIRRPGRRPFVRLSVQSVFNPTITYHEGSYSSPHGTWVCIENATLGPTYTRGEFEDLTWDLYIEPVVGEIVPLKRLGPIGRILPLSFRVESLPAVKLCGRVTFRGKSWEGESWGAITHGWGHALPHHWFWLQAPIDPHTHTFVEALIATQQVWKVPWPHIRVGYFWLSHEGKETFILHPFTGHISLWGPPDNVLLRAVPWHGEGYAVHCRAHPKIWQKLGNDIINTLTGQARIFGVGDCYSSARIEWRRPPIY